MNRRIMIKVEREGLEDTCERLTEESMRQAQLRADIDKVEQQIDDVFGDTRPGELTYSQAVRGKRLYWKLAELKAQL